MQEAFAFHPLYQYLYRLTIKRAHLFATPSICNVLFHLLNLFISVTLQEGILLQEEIEIGLHFFGAEPQVAEKINKKIWGPNEPDDALHS